MADKRNNSLSLIRIIACMAVVLLHTANLAMAVFAPEGDMRIATASMRNLMLWSVPCFVMVTGVLLLDPAKEITYKKLFGKYIKRILITLVVFTLIYKITDILIDKTPFTPALITEYLASLVFGTSWSHVWYLYLILAVYLLLPFYRMVASKAEAKDMRYLLIVLIVFQSLLAIVTDMTGKTPAFYILVSTIFPLFLYAGYAIDKGYVKLNKIVSAALILLCIAGMITFSILATKLQSPEIGAMVTSYHFIFTVLLAICVFALMNKLNVKGGKIFASLDGSTFGIYLVHMVILNVLYRAIGFNPYSIGVYILPVIAILTFALSWGIVAALRLIPFIRKIL
ncbi:MAG: acyltransferase family protein [Saccharofermentans sp.]|nr:acyltransferase family protein [Saccharofermentans sp.]